MGVANAVHPPGGATALMAAVDPAVSALGWLFVPLVLLGSLLMLLCALLVNNIQRQFPAFWWSPRDVGRAARDGGGGDVETGSSVGGDTLGSVASLERKAVQQQALVITSEHVVLPDGFGLGVEEAEIMEILRARLRSHLAARAGASDPSSLASFPISGDGKESKRNDHGRT